PPPPVVLERTREHPLPSSKQSRPDRVTHKPRHRPPIEHERHHPRPIQPLARLLWKPGHGAESGGAVHNTSFERVSRSARNHPRQPERWYHHSRCTPATLRRK